MRLKKNFKFLQLKPVSLKLNVAVAMPMAQGSHAAATSLGGFCTTPAEGGGTGTGAALWRGVAPLAGQPRRPESGFALTLAPQVTSRGGARLRAPCAFRRQRARAMGRTLPSRGLLWREQPGREFYCSCWSKDGIISVTIDDYKRS